MSSRAVPLKSVQKRIRIVYRSVGKSWTKAAREIGVSRGTLIRIDGGYEPKTPSIRRALGLPVYAAVQVCPRCGQVHPQRRRHVSSDPALLKAICEIAVPFLTAHEQRDETPYVSS